MTLEVCHEGRLLPLEQRRYHCPEGWLLLDPLLVVGAVHRMRSLINSWTRT